MQAMLNVAVRAARAAGRITTRSFSQPEALEVELKSTHDYVTSADKAAEEAIMQTIHRYYPDHGIHAEESGSSHSESPYQWVIDPIDGTTNFMRNIPHFCISIAVTYKGKAQQAVVYDPIREEMFTASKGSGARLNDQRLRVTKLANLDGALLATGFPFRMKHLLPEYQEIFNTFFSQAADIRRAGAAALDLAYVAAGRYDGFWEAGLQPWDTMAGELLVREAGGIVTDFGGGTNHHKSGNIVAGNPKVLQAMLGKMRPLLPASLKS